MPASATTGLAALDTWDDEGRLQAVIEAPRDSANKLKFDPRRGVFTLHGVLPMGVAFPFDFGFVAGTLGEDGDPLDVLVLMDEPTFPGVVVPCRLIGVIKATQRPKDDRRTKATRNDRLVAVADKSHRHRDTRALADLGDAMLAEIERFFIFYNDQKGVRFEPIGRAGKSSARKLVDAGRRAARA